MDQCTRQCQKMWVEDNPKDQNFFLKINKEVGMLLPKKELIQVE